MDRIGLGIVGLNFGRHIVAEAVKDPVARLFRLVALCDLERGKAEALAVQAGARVEASLDAMLAAPDIRVVGLFTGPNGRAELVRRIIRAGKDCLTTKPFEVDAAAAAEVLHEARRLGRVVHMNSPGPLPSPDLACIAEWRERHGLGRPVAAHAETWASYREKADGSWYDDPQRCPVAPLMRLGIYLVNDLIAIMGEPARVQVQTSRLFTERPTPDNAQATIAFRSGALASVFASFCIKDGDHYRNQLILHFENGTIYRNAGPERGSATGELSLIMSGPDGKRVGVERRTVEALSGLYQWEALSRAVRGERLAGEIAPEQVAAGLRVIAAMRKAEATGMPVDVAAL